MSKNNEPEEIEFAEPEESQDLKALDDFSKDKLSEHLFIGTADDDPMECDALFFAREDSSDFPLVLPKAFIVDANLGHHEAISDSAKNFIQVIVSSVKMEELSTQGQIVMSWGLECLERMANGAEPNQAFCWTSTTPGKRSKSVRGQIHDWLAALAVAVIKRDNPGMPIMETKDHAGSVCDRVAEMLLMSPAAVEKAWKKHAPDIRERMDF